MNKEIKKLWVAWLRNLDNEQGHFYLNTGLGFCCLGGLCEVYREFHPETKWEKLSGKGNDTGAYVSFFDATSFLPSEVSQWAGLPNEIPSVRTGEQSVKYLTELNDSGNSFLEIADYIEADPDF